MPASTGFSAQFNFSNGPGTVPAGYINDVGMVYGSALMQPASNPQAVSEIGAPTGTYRFHSGAPHPSAIDTLFALEAEGLLQL
jgi:hypothetical protein